MVLDTRPSAPPKCPYSIDLLSSSEKTTSYVLREKDEFGEFPNIYAQVYYGDDTRTPEVIFLSDTGTGKNSDNDMVLDSPASWNVATFLAHTLNPKHTIPYIILITHAHYDHIMGIGSLQKAGADLTIYASSHDKGYLVPWSNLQKHSLADTIGLKVPEYDARWAEDAQKLTYVDRLTGQRKEMPITMIHTPGHTPDSLSWYDQDSNVLSVGDMIYERESDWTRSGSNGQWAREPPQPIIFNQASKIVDWNASLHRLLDFVRLENRRLGTDAENTEARSGYRQTGFGTKLEYSEDAKIEDEWSVITSVPARRRVVLSAAHVTVVADAEFALLDALAFMLRIQLDQVPRKHVKQDPEGSDDLFLWDDDLGSKENNKLRDSSTYRYSVKAPWSVIHAGSGIKPPNSIDVVADKVETASVRSVTQRTTMSRPKAMMRAPLKSTAVATISHGNAMAHRN